MTATLEKLNPLGRLQFVVKPVPSTDIGQKGELKWLPLSALYIDPVYQREILKTGQANVRRMIEDFSWLQFGTVIVAARRGGRYAVIDGQHRATAALMHGGIAEVPCLILKGGVAAEARAFAAINGNVTRINSLQSFAASVAAGDEAAVHLFGLAAGCDVIITRYPKQEMAPGETQALGTLQTCIKRQGEKSLVAALRLLRAIDPESGLPSVAIAGTCAALADKPERMKELNALIRTMAVRGGGLAQLMADTAKRKGNYGGPSAKNFEILIAAAIDTAIRNQGQNMARLMAGR